MRFKMLRKIAKKNFFFCFKLRILVRLPNTCVFLLHFLLYLITLLFASESYLLSSSCFLVPPEEPRIFDAQGKEINQTQTAGPFREGYELFLCCQVKGGKFWFLYFFLFFFLINFFVLFKYFFYLLFCYLFFLSILIFFLFLFMATVLMAVQPVVVLAKVEIKWNLSLMNFIMILLISVTVFIY